MLLFLLQTASFAQSSILFADTCFSPEDRKKIAIVFVEHTVLKEKDSLNNIIIAKNEKKLEIADTIIAKQKSIIRVQDIAIDKTDKELKRVNILLQDQKKQNFFNRIFGGTMTVGIIALTGTLLYFVAIR